MLRIEIYQANKGTHCTMHEDKESIMKVSYGCKVLFFKWKLKWKGFEGEDEESGD